MAAKPNVPNIQKDGPPGKSPLPPAKVIETRPATGTLKESLSESDRVVKEANSQ